MDANKTIFLYTFLLVVWVISSAQAQVDRSEPPKAGPAPEIQFSKPTTFTLDNGLEVIVSENHEIPLVSFQLTIDADPVREGDAAGYVGAAGNLIRNGTSRREKAEIDEAVDFIGASLNTYKNGIYASCLNKQSEEMLEIMSEVVTSPTYPTEEVEKYKKNTISNLTSSETNASFIANRVSRKLRNDGHPYGELETKATVKNITREDCMNYYKKYYKPNISYLVMVGDITPEEAKSYAKKYFGNWGKEEVPNHNYDFPERTEGTQVAMVDKEDAVQSVISVTYPLKLKVGDEDAIKTQVMNNILGGGVFSGYLMQNLREDKGYTYGARSTVSKDPEVGYFRANAEVGAEVTDSAVHEFLHEMQRIRNEKVDTEHLDLVKNVITGQFARSLEDAQTVARFALNTQRYDLPGDYYANYLKNVEQVTADEVQQVAQKYILPEESIIIVVGDKEKVSEKLGRFSTDEQVELYSHTGEPVEAAAPLPEDLTAQKVIEKYIEAIGGREKINKIDDLQQIGSVSMMGRSVTIKSFREAPDKFANITEMNGQVVQKQVYDGEKSKMVAMGQEREIQGEQLKNLRYDAKMFKFLRYDELDVKLELQGIESVDDEKAYKIRVINPAGQVHYDFYSVDSGLKIQTQSTQQTQQGEVTSVEKFSDYRPVEGVKFPYKIDISGPQSMTLEIESYKVNEGIDSSVFDL
ncbi:MAG: pitrilysin family protein [Desulfobacterales bacterium]